MQPDWGAPTTAVGADKNIFGRVFIGHQSSGYAFADSDEVTPPVAAANSSRSRVRSR